MTLTERIEGKRKKLLSKRMEKKRSEWRKDREKSICPDGHDNEVKGKILPIGKIKALDATETRKGKKTIC